MNKRAVLISGGILDEQFVLEQINLDEDYIIGIDSGVEFLYRQGITPDYIVGDFDSLASEIVAYYKEHTHIPVQKLNIEKDASDTEEGVRLAISLRFQEILILGATGSRMDHVWANVQALTIAKRASVSASIMDAHNKIYLIDGKTRIRKHEAFGTFFSVFPLGGSVEQFSIEGAKYPLYNHNLCPYNSLCVSNQIEDREVVITFPQGLVIVMETRD